MNNDPRSSETIGKGRVETLADGVFGIAMTLLVLQFKVPDLKPEQMDQLWDWVIGLLPKLSAYCISFMTCGVYWVSHQVQMNYVYRSDRLFMWVNILFLMIISAIPFSAALIGEYHDSPLSIRIYCANLILAGLVLYLQKLYAEGPGRLVRPDVDPDFMRLTGRRILMGPAIYAIAAIAAGHFHLVSHFLCALVPILYIRPGRIDVYWK